MPSQKWRKQGKQGREHYEKGKGFFDGMDQENSKKQEGKTKRECCECGGSHTHVFSIDPEHPPTTTLM
jgi:hypothetical protein